MTKDRHHSIFSNLEVRIAARTNHVPSSGLRRSSWKPGRAHEALPLHVQHAQDRGQSHTCSMAGTAKVGHRGHPNAAAPRRAPVPLQLLPPVNLTSLQAPAIFSTFHYTGRGGTKSPSEVTEQLFSEMQSPAASGSWGNCTTLKHS